MLYQVSSSKTKMEKIVRVPEDLDLTNAKDLMNFLSLMNQALNIEQVGLFNVNIKPVENIVDADCYVIRYEDRLVIMPQ